MNAASGSPFARPEGLDSRQAWWGVRYVSAICNQAGYSFVPPPPDGDVHSLDGEVVMRPGLGVSVQIKCTNLPITRQRSWYVKKAWRKNWKLLTLPGYFVQVSVPPDTKDWVEHPDEPVWTTLMRCAAFWTRIDPLPDSQTSVTVRTADRLTVDTLDVWADHLEQAVRTGFSGGGAP